MAPTPHTNVLVRGITKLLCAYAAPLLDSRIEESGQPFTAPNIILPHDSSKWWGWTHYGVFITDLPEPYRYLNTMTFIGAPGVLCFDNDYLSAPDARNTATVLSSTAYGDTHHYEAYDAASTCEFAADGSRLAWGNDLVITSNYPNFTVAGRYRHMQVKLQISATKQVSWFVRSPVYDHLSLLATYTGTITDDRGTTDIAGMCTVEYARSMTPQALSRHPIPPQLKIPVHFFTYQILHLDKRTQLLLTDVRADGVTLCKLAHVRNLDGEALVHQDVAFEVLSYRKQHVTDPRGRSMRAPERMKWTVRDEDQEIIRFVASVDSPLRYGHGQGYVASYQFTGKWRNKDVSGIGYLEWIDLE
ncbi:hypothetical protein MGU_07498 [Metarhizium guizhouense ARSEF 977]|uniref:Uncharacterized protein n=1 Tax=Metarhizium guizhouense (strain ARSEF 977) TaxID=1276136 RepID=A0A0B4GE43_METGA|nr:hypothetical protein MGU_07498 [Metarhizium guizhouense ARSEF 977]